MNEINAVIAFEMEVNQSEVGLSPFLEAGLEISDQQFEEWAANNIIPLDDFREMVVPLEEGSCEDGAAAPELLNDAEILGTEPEGFADFLATEVTFLTGELWGMRDRRNTQDGNWKGVTMPWGAWIGGAPGSKNAPAWGFSRHPIGKDKAGASIVLGSSIGGARKAKAMDTMFAMGLDVDSGAKLDDVLDRIEELGLLCLVYTSHSHGKRGIELKRDEVLRKLQIKTDPTTAQVRQFLRDHDKNRYEESFIAGCEIEEQKHQTTEGVKIVLKTPALEKFRLIFPLAKPVKLIDLAETHEGSLTMWEDKITGLARNVLNVHFDTSCTDPSRLFYTARHPKDAEDWYCAVVMGQPVVFEDVEPFKKSTYTSKREVNAFTLAGGEDDDRPKMCLTPSGKSLNDWHTRNKDRFMLADLLETLCPDRIRHSGGEAQGHVHVECPFEHEHTSEGGTACMAINCIDSQNEYWTWFCHHDSCQGRHKLEFLEEALRAGWFEEEALFDIDLGFLLEGEDDDGEILEDLLTKAYGFDATTGDNTVNALLADAHAHADVIGVSGKNRLTDAIVAATSLGKRDVNKAWKATKPMRQKGVTDAQDVRADFDVRCDYAIERVRQTNREDPHLFRYMGRFATVDADNAQPKVLDIFGLFPVMADITVWTKSDGDNNMTKVSPPDDVMKYIFNSDRLLNSLPEVVSVKTTPFFASDGTLVTTEGYHDASKGFLCLNGEVFPEVSETPSEAEVFEAKRLLVEEVLADFPLGGASRGEIMREGMNGDGIPALANALAMILLPFAREMINGPTPFHLLNKPSPGTGAGFLADLTSIIGTGKETAPATLPKKQEETGKTLTSVLMDGGQIIFFDNISHSLDSSELAAAATAPAAGYKARILGRSQTVQAKISQTWILTANALTMSDELLRRSVLVDLDRKVPKPGLFKPKNGWRHRDVRRWAQEHRVELVHACLTLIQHWVASGMKPATDVTLASFENWASVMGGILSAAGIGGFMGNREMLTEMSDGNTDVLSEVMQAITDVMAGNPDARLYTGKTSAEDNQKGRVGLLDVLNGMDEPPRLDNWGYRENLDNGEIRVEYQNAQKVGKRFKQAAKGTYAVTIGGEGRNVSFKAEYDSNQKKNYYTLVVS